MPGLSSGVEVNTIGHPGDVIDSRFKLTTLLSTGALATVWKAFDTSAQSQSVVKLYATEGMNAITEQYTAHVWDVAERLKESRWDKSGVVCAVASGQTRDSLYQAFPFVDNASLLANAISSFGPLHPGMALKCLVNICHSLEVLHRHQIIHADLKPSNILISHAGDRAFLLDLGMTDLVNNKRDLILVSTPKYLAPDIIQSSDHDRDNSKDRLTKFLDDDKATTSISYAGGRMVGPYVDVYALAISMLEMTTGSTIRPTFVSQASLASRLRAENTEIGKFSAFWVDALAELIEAMLSVSPKSGWETVVGIRRKSLELQQLFGQPDLSSQIWANFASSIKNETVVPSPTANAGEVTKAVMTLNAVSQDLTERTAIFIQEETKLQSVTHEQDHLIDKISLVFENALSRSRKTWKIGMGLTIACFVLISGMIVTAVILTVLTGKASWALIFGGASVPLIIGTLIWKPYDLAFNATIRSQQIELIHVQIQTVFGGTKLIDERVKSCQEAVASLQRLYAPTSRIRSGRSGVPKSSSRKSSVAS